MARTAWHCSPRTRRPTTAGAHVAPAGPLDPDRPGKLPRQRPPPWGGAWNAEINAYTSRGEPNPPPISTDFAWGHLGDLNPGPTDYETNSGRHGYEEIPALPTVFIPPRPTQTYPDGWR